MSHRGIYVALMLLALTPVMPYVLASEDAVSVEDLVRAALRSYRYNRVLELAERIASLGPRAPGYPGYNATVDLIVSTAKSLNLKVCV
ncbi:MAG: hypothetical protein DRK00_11370, partial [Thermoprotei archaeon]